MVHVQNDVEPILQPVFLEGHFRGRGADRRRQSEIEHCAGGDAGKQEHGARLSQNWPRAMQRPGASRMLGAPARIALEFRPE